MNYVSSRSLPSSDICWYAGRRCYVKNICLSYHCERRGFFFVVAVLCADTDC